MSLGEDTILGILVTYGGGREGAAKVWSLEGEASFVVFVLWKCLSSSK